MVSVKMFYTRKILGSQKFIILFFCFDQKKRGVIVGKGVLVKSTGRDIRGSRYYRRNRNRYWSFLKGSCKIQDCIRVYPKRVRKDYHK